MNFWGLWGNLCIGVWAKALFPPYQLFPGQAPPGLPISVPEYSGLYLFESTTLQCSGGVFFFFFFKILFNFQLTNSAVVVSTQNTRFGLMGCEKVCSWRPRNNSLRSLWCKKVILLKHGTGLMDRKNGTGVMMGNLLYTLSLGGGQG